jgi:hypothetical protein
MTFKLGFKGCVGILLAEEVVEGSSRKIGAKAWRHERLITK